MIKQMMKKSICENSSCKEKSRSSAAKRGSVIKWLFTVPGENVNTAHFIIPVSSPQTQLFIHTNQSAERRHIRDTLRFQTLNVRPALRKR